MNPPHFEPEQPPGEQPGGIASLAFRMRIVWPAKLDVVVGACGCFEFCQFRRSPATRPATTSYLLSSSIAPAKDLGRGAAAKEVDRAVALRCAKASFGC